MASSTCSRFCVSGINEHSINDSRSDTVKLLQKRSANAMYLSRALSTSPWCTSRCRSIAGCLYPPLVPCHSLAKIVALCFRACSQLVLHQISTPLCHNSWFTRVVRISGPLRRACRYPVQFPFDYKSLTDHGVTLIKASLAATKLIRLVASALLSNSSVIRSEAQHGFTLTAPNLLVPEYVLVTKFVEAVGFHSSRLQRAPKQNHSLISRTSPSDARGTKLPKPPRKGLGKPSHRRTAVKATSRRLAATPCELTFASNQWAGSDKE
jgi:hypothetical protein